jgi:hypothetical protein
MYTTKRMILVTHGHPGLADAVAALIRQKGFPAKPARNGFKCVLAMLDHPPEQPLLEQRDSHVFPRSDALGCA